MAGSRFGLNLLWALTFSTIGTILLQEAAARITIGTGLSLGELIVQTYGLKVRWLMLLLFSAVALGCAAYQAGNILGAVSGLVMLTNGSAKLMTLLVGSTCVLLLWQGSTRFIANVLGLIVFAMGAAFVYVAVKTDSSPGMVAKALIIPTLPPQSLVLVIGLIGTTIVPYNLFLGSGLGQHQSLLEMRLGISLAVLIGGIISMAILIAGTFVSGTFSLQLVAQELGRRLGSWAGILFAFGLFAAGFTSCLTAPLAASVTAKSLLGWSETSTAYRIVWLTVMAIGLIFGLLNVKPVPVIILAQAANGILLPIVTIFLLIAVNNKTILSSRYRNSIWQNIAMIIVVAVTAFLGIRNLWLVFQ